MLFKLFLTGALFFSFNLLFGQTKLDSAKVFKEYELHGRTTEGASAHIEQLHKNNFAAHKLSRHELTELNEIIQKTKDKKHEAQKYELNNYYMIGYKNGAPHKYIITTQNMIVDLSTGKEYPLSEKQSQKLNSLVRNWR